MVSGTTGARSGSMTKPLTEQQIIAGGNLIRYAIDRYGAVQLGLTQSEMTVLRQLALYARKNRPRTFPSEATIARQGGISRKTVARCKQSLRKRLFRGKPLLNWGRIPQADGRYPHCWYELENLHVWAKQANEEARNLAAEKDRIKQSYARAGKITAQALAEHLGVSFERLREFARHEMSDHRAVTIRHAGQVLNRFQLDIIMLNSDSLSHES